MKNMLRTVFAGVAFTACLNAASFEDGYALMREDMGAVRSNISLKKFFAPSEKLTDANGNEILRYRKEVAGYPVFGEEKIVVFPKSEGEFRHLDTVRGLSQADLDFVQTNASAAPEAKISLDQAMQAAVKDLRTSGAYIPDSLPAHLRRDASLFMYRNDQGAYELVYHLVLPGQYMMAPTAFDYFVNAETGAIVDKVRQLYDIQGKGVDLSEGTVRTFAAEAEGEGCRMEDKSRNLQVFNSIIGKFSTDEDCNWDSVGTSRKNNQRAEVELILNMARVIDYFGSTHGFVWGKGQKPVKATAHVQDNYNNAYYSSWQGGFFFGDGSGDAKGFDYLTKGLDVAGHEYTHGVIDSLCPLTYQGESGALNEHIADFFGAMVDNDEWQMGDNIAIGDNPALRNMQDPTRGHGHLITEEMTYSEWVKMNKESGVKGRIYPDRVSRKIICSSWGEDNGGVHINSSIFNKFAYLATTGAEIEREGLGYDLMADIYFRVLKDRWLSNRSTFNEFRSNFMAAAELHMEGSAKKDQHLETLRLAFRKIDL